MTAGAGIGARRRQWIDARPRPPLSERFAAAQTFEEFLESAQTLREFWHASARRASGDPALVERVIATGRNWRLLVLTATIAEIVAILEQCTVGRTTTAA